MNSQTVVKALGMVCSMVLVSSSAGSSHDMTKPPPIDCKISGTSPTAISYAIYTDVEGLKIYREDNSWGHGSRGFDVAMKDDMTKIFQFIKQERNWKHNFPGTIELHRDKPLVTTINLCDGTWRAVPDLPSGKPLTLRLSPLFSIPRDNMNSGAWVGHFKGDPQEFVFNPECIDKLNGKFATD